MDDIEVKRKKYQKYAVICLMLIVVGFIAPFIYMMVKGIIGLIVAAASVLIAIQFAPVFAAIVANAKLKMTKAEATKNPVETLQNEYAQKLQELAESKEQMKIFMAELAGFADTVKAFKRDPTNLPEDVTEYEQQLEMWKELETEQMEKYTDAEDQVKEFQSVVRRAENKWKMSQAANKMNEAAGLISGDDFMRQLKVETALDSVSLNMNKALADLKMSVKKRVDIKKKEIVANKNDSISNIIENVQLKKETK